jgi:multiple sugar transport system ATP-binding protein
MASVQLKNLNKTFGGGVHAVVDVNLEIGNGEFIVLVGPSGCGKSTTLRMIAGLEDVTRGTVSIDGRVVNDVPPKDRNIAMVFQNYALYPHMTVYENMAFALRLRNEPKPEIDRRVREAGEILDIGSILDRKPRQLSGGQRQRVAVGRAIVRHPRVFLFDEPLSNLDAKLRVQTRKEIARMHRQLDATMIYVTHDQVEAMTMGDRIVVMSAGLIQQIGAPLDLYENPANQFVAGFIGSPAMNFIAGTVEERDGELAIRAPDAGLHVPLPASARAQFAGDRVVVGVRPEDVYLEGATMLPPDIVFAEAVIDAVEPMGNEVFVYASAGTSELVARVAPDRLPRAEERLRLVLDRDRLHYFDAASGNVIPGLRSPARARAAH